MICATAYLKQEIYNLNTRRDTIEYDSTCSIESDSMLLIRFDAN